MQKKPTKYLQIKPEDLKKIEQRRDIKESNKIESEWVALAEFGIMFGWEAIKDVDNNVISKYAFNMLLRAGRKVLAINRFDNLESMFTAYISAQSKEPLKTLKSLSSELLKEVNS